MGENTSGNFKEISDGPISPIVLHRNLKSKDFDFDLDLEDTVLLCTLIIEKILSFSGFLKKRGRYAYFNRTTVNDDTDSGSSDRSYDSMTDYTDIKDYIVRVVSYMKMEKSMIILSMMLLDKLMALNNDLTITENNIHKIIFMCFMETEKFYDDCCFSNKDFSKIGCIPAEELLFLEIKFMEMIQYQMFIEESKFFQYCDKLKNLWIQFFP